METWISLQDVWYKQPLPQNNLIWAINEFKFFAQEEFLNTFWKHKQNHFLYLMSLHLSSVTSWVCCSVKFSPCISIPTVSFVQMFGHCFALFPHSFLTHHPISLALENKRFGQLCFMDCCWYKNMLPLHQIHKCLQEISAKKEHVKCFCALPPPKPPLHHQKNLQPTKNCMFSFELLKWSIKVKRNKNKDEDISFCKFMHVIHEMFALPKFPISLSPHSVMKQSVWSF